MQRLVKQSQIILSNEEIAHKVKSATIKYQNFPKPGVSFIDIFPIISEPQIFSLVIEAFERQLKDVQYDKLFMLQSKGFLFGPSLSLKVGKSCYPVRKKGKLPGECVELDYGLEYGSDTIEIQKHLLKEGDKVVLIDDVLATGGTLNAAIALVEKLGGEVVQILLLNQIKALNGIEKLKIPKERVYSIYYE